nr:hypothetical protein [Tanacetum cinerariifolium]
KAVFTRTDLKPVDTLRLVNPNLTRRLRFAGEGITNMVEFDIRQEDDKVSFINQSWCTANARTLDNGEIELNATVDGQHKTITEASVRRHLKLADADDKVTTLENELQSTKSVYNKALITLTKRVKKLEKKLKHKRRREVVDSSKDEEASLDKEDSPRQGRLIGEINEDENVNLVKSTKDKDKAIMQEFEPLKEIKKK